MLIVEAGLLVLFAMYLAVEGGRAAARLQLVELRHIAYQFGNECLQLHVFAKVSTGQDLLPALRAFLFVLSIVVFDALGAKFVEAVLDVEWAREHIRTHLTQQALF